MRRPGGRRLLAAGAAVSLATALGVTAVTTTAAAAVTGSPSGYATQNGGTTGGAGGQTVRATTGTQIHEALCSRASDDTPIIIEVEGTINHGNTSKVSRTEDSGHRFDVWLNPGATFEGVRVEWQDAKGKWHVH